MLNKKKQDRTPIGSLFLRLTIGECFDIPLYIPRPPGLGFDEPASRSGQRKVGELRLVHNDHPPSLDVKGDFSSHFHQL